VLALDFCSVTYDITQRLDVDIVMCKTAIFYSNGSIDRLRDFDANNVNRVINNVEMLRMYADVYNEYVSACSKLFRKEIFTGQKVSFCEGTLYEEGLPVLESIIVSSSYSLMSDVMYFYRKGRSGSITENARIIAENIEDKFKQYCLMIEKYNSIGEDIVPIEYKRKYASFFISAMESDYLEYQYQALKSLIIADAITDEQNYFLIGASEESLEYEGLLRKKTNRIFCVDNNKSVHGDMVNGHPVLSVDDMVSMIDIPYRIVLTSLESFSIFYQLIDSGAVSSIDKLFLYNAETNLERAYRDGFLMQLRLKKLICN
jgi:hypothetical protein